MTLRIDVIGTNGNDGEHYSDPRRNKLPIAEYSCGHEAFVRTGDAVAVACNEPGCKGLHVKVRNTDMGISGKQPRYQDAKGEDWIDEFARTATAEEFRGAMRFTIGKYVRRAGKKDALESEIEKMRDYAARWLEVERNR